MFPVMEKYLSYAATYENREGLVCYGLGDWNYPKNISFRVCPTELTDSCYYREMLSIAAEFSLLFSPEREQVYRERAEKVKGAILQKYADETSLTGMAALTFFRIADRGADIAAYLEKNGYVLHCGILGARFLMMSLLQMQRSDIAYRLLMRTEYPSFGYWAKQGQTSLCEDFELTNSLNHHMYSCIAEYMMKGFCGVRLNSGSESAFLQPDIPREITSFECTVAGILVQYRREEREKFRICVPEGKSVRMKYCGKDIAFLSGEHFLEI